MGVALVCGLDWFTFEFQQVCHAVLDFWTSHQQTMNARRTNRENQAKTERTSLCGYYERLVSSLLIRDKSFIYMEVAIGRKE